MVEINVQAKAYVTETIRRSFQRGASSSFLADLKRESRRSGIGSAIRTRDVKRLFRWLILMLGYQGISNRAADQFTAKHGFVGWRDLHVVAKQPVPCPKLQTYWHFEGCGYRKGQGTCGRPDLLASCGLARLPLRKGRLNQSAMSLYLFVRDICGGDLIGWLDARLREVSAQTAAMRVSALLEPMRQIHGLSDKVLSMLLSALLLSAGRRKSHWFETGASFVVVDTLVHNHLHRTGVMAAINGEHPYGAACYGPNGCAAAIQIAAADIDARIFNPTFPAYFPRLVQHAVWRVCALDGLDICNGTRIDDRYGCQNRYCPDFAVCCRLPLTAQKPRKIAISEAS